MKNDDTYPIVRRLSDIETKPISWLWEKQIARGKLTVISGDPGLGKSQITAFIASTVSTGGEWPVGGGSAPLGSVIMLNAEDDPADTIRPRLEALEADLDKIHWLHAIQHEDKVRSFHLDRDLEYLEVMLRDNGDTALIVIDPISTYLGRKDSYKDSDIRALLAPLSRIAEENNVAVIAISHLNKSSEKKAMHRVSGSIALVASARTAFTVIADREDPQRRLMLQLKNNLARDGKGFAFRLKTVEVDSGIDTSKRFWR